MGVLSRLTRMELSKKMIDKMKVQARTAFHEEQPAQPMSTGLVTMKLGRLQNPPQ
jgi:hypothetical protein